MPQQGGLELALHSGYTLAAARAPSPQLDRTEPEMSIFRSLPEMQARIQRFSAMLRGARPCSCTSGVPGGPSGNIPAPSHGWCPGIDRACSASRRRTLPRSPPIARSAGARICTRHGNATERTSTRCDSDRMFMWGQSGALPCCVQVDQRLCAFADAPRLRQARHSDLAPVDGALLLNVRLGIGPGVPWSALGAASCRE